MLYNACSTTVAVFEKGVSLEHSYAEWCGRSDG